METSIAAEQTNAGPWPRRRIVAIVNPATRRPAARLTRLLHDRLPAGVALDLRQTTRAGETARLTRDALPGAELVIAVGGDGTVAAVASALAEARAEGGPDVPLAIVPAGSTNITARELRIPMRPTKAIDLAYGHAPQTLTAIDLGRSGGECFLHMAGAGLDSRLFAETDPALKRRLGWLAYLPPTVKNLRLAPARFRIEADETTLEVESPLVIVANGGAIISSHLPLYPDISTTDGWLDVLIFTPRGVPEIARTLGRLLTLRLHRSPFVRRLRARRVRLEADPPQPIQLDGDVYLDGGAVLSTPATFEVQPRALRVVTPGG